MTAEQRQQMIAAAAAQRYVEFTGGETTYAGGTTNELTASTDPVQREFFDFYRTPRGEFTPPGSSPERTTKPTLTSVVRFMNYYPLERIEEISAAAFCHRHRRPLPGVQRGRLQPRGRAEGDRPDSKCRTR
ncbi:hypothetical protein JOY44_23875 [Phormidium sp. CLA17]|uniref:hypothetical protein n=1 Tax=Leptolyngbya sp. Cla-17 TaxID=2803751 RepID=UPI0018D9D190|nr:hypothetical protein [Leptolyngbya sp. Cla-17]MBM0744610.1 hypothetical protein [Leptolyngbya sp. Cla-17]